MLSPDRLERRARQEQLLSPRPGIKLAVIRRTLRVSAAEAGLRKSKVGFWQDFVYVEDVPEPIFTAIRNPWEITGDDEGTKQSALDCVINVELNSLPDSADKAFETFRAERLRGVNYSKRTYNIDKARVEGERMSVIGDSRTSFYLLTPRYHSEQRPTSK